MKIFRVGQASHRFGVVLTLACVVILAMTPPLFTGDLRALPSSILACLPVLVLGFWMLARSYFSRFELTDDRLRKFDFRNHVVFDVRWSDVRGYVRGKRGGWSIDAGETPIRIGRVAEYTELQQAIVKRLPLRATSALRAATRPAIKALATLEGPCRKDGDLFVVLFSLGWYALLAYVAYFFGWLVSHVPTGMKGVPIVIGLVFEISMGLFLVCVLGSIWRRFFFDRYRLDDQGITYRAGRNQRSISWSALIFAEEKITGRDGRLALASADQTITLFLRLRDLPKVRDWVVANAPGEAIVAIEEVNDVRI